MRMHARKLKSAHMVPRAPCGPQSCALLTFFETHDHLYTLSLCSVRSGPESMCPQTTQWKLKVGKEGRESLTRLYLAFTKETHARVLWRNCPFLETCVNGRNQLWNGGGRETQTSLKEMKAF